MRSMRRRSCICCRGGETRGLRFDGKRALPLVGLLALAVARRGRRGAGAFLVALAAVCLILHLLVAYNVLPYGWPESEWPLALRVLKTRFYDGLLTTNSMSAYGFVLFAGLKCLLPEKEGR